VSADQYPTRTDYPIRADSVWWYLFGPDHQIIRKFKVKSWTKEEVQAYRAGLLKGLTLR
jgi:hypothetical protein